MEQKTKQLLDLIMEYDKIKQIYLSSYEMLATLRDELRVGKYELEDMINFIYVIREISKLTNDLRKEADGISHMFENSTCAIYVALNKMGPIRATLATGSPDLKLGVKVPNRDRDPEKFEALMKYFGLPFDPFVDRVVKPHWPGICEQVSLLAEEGKPLPPGIDPNDTYPTYTVRIRSRQDADELVLNLKGKEVEICDKLLTTKQRKK